MLLIIIVLLTMIGIAIERVISRLDEINKKLN